MEITTDDDGVVQMNRTNDGYTISELLGFLEITSLKMGLKLH